MDNRSQDQPDLMRMLGPLAFASRLKRLQEKLFRDVSRIYQDQEVQFEPRWFLVFYAILKTGPAAVTAIAEALGISHAAVSQTAGELLKAGLIGESRDATDERRRLLTVTTRGRTVAKKLGPVWSDISTATEAAIAATGVDVLSALEEMERGLADTDLVTRVTHARLKRTRAKVRIVNYRPRYAEAFARLNFDWIQQFFTIEAEDARLLENPEAEIIRPGGAILCALVEGKVAGVCALIRHGANRYELAKMAVDRPYRGMGLGEQLGRAVIAKARKLGASILFLLTSDKLQPAIHLYKRLGFKVMQAPAPEIEHYARCTFAMEIKLKPEKSPSEMRRAIP